MSSSNRSDYITYRIEKSKESLYAAELMADNCLYTSAVNRCFYACFYMVDALLYQHQLAGKSHSGAKTLFNLHFVKTGKLNIEIGEIFNELLDLRQEGDYGSKFEIEQKDIQILISDTKRFIKAIEGLLSE
jgi:uncharacterized protein (UPF0332 family)